VVHGGMAEVETMERQEYGKALKKRTNCLTARRLVGEKEIGEKRNSRSRLSTVNSRFKARGGLDGCGLRKSRPWGRCRSYTRTLSSNTRRNDEGSDEQGARKRKFLESSQSKKENLGQKWSELVEVYKLKWRSQMGGRLRPRGR